MKRLAVADADKCTGCQLCMFACNRRFGSGGLERAALRVRSVGGMERGFTVVVCRACPDPPCSKVCPTDALRSRIAGVVLDEKRCIGCGNCVNACPFGAVLWDIRINKPIICVHCGYCVPYCPHEVLTMEEWPR